jgi:hypothetical protein
VVSVIGRVLFSTPVTQREVERVRAMERVMRVLSPLLADNLLSVAAGAYPIASQFDSVAAFIELNRAWAAYERVVKEKP